MTRRARGPLGSALVVTLVGLLAGCGILGRDDEAAQGAETALEQQRSDVRDSSLRIMSGAAAELSGRILESRGYWEGCDSAFNDEFRNFRYFVSARIQAGDDALGGDLLGPLESVLGAEGFALEASEAQGLRATRGDLVASLRTVASGGASGGVLLQLTGSCIDVPEDERDDWLRRDEPTPQVHEDAS